MLVGVQSCPRDRGDFERFLRENIWLMRVKYLLVMTVRVAEAISVSVTFSL